MLKTIGTGTSFPYSIFQPNILYYYLKFCCMIISLLHDEFHRYEWKYRGLAHIHGFMWLEGALDMEQLDWKDTIRVDAAR